MLGQAVIQGAVTSRYHWGGSGACVPVTFLAVVARAPWRCMCLALSAWA